MKDTRTTRADTLDTTWECPDCGSRHDVAPCIEVAADCDCCRAIIGEES